MKAQLSEVSAHHALCHPCSFIYRFLALGVFPLSPTVSFYECHPQFHVRSVWPTSGVQKSSMSTERQGMSFSRGVNNFLQHINLSVYVNDVFQGVKFCPPCCCFSISSLWTVFCGWDGSTWSISRHGPVTNTAYQGSISKIIILIYAFLSPQNSQA